MIKFKEVLRTNQWLEWHNLWMGGNKSADPE